MSYNAKKENLTIEVVLDVIKEYPGARLKRIASALDHKIYGIKGGANKVRIISPISVSYKVNEMADKGLVSIERRRTGKRVWPVKEEF